MWKKSSSSSSSSSQAQATGCLGNMDQVRQVFDQYDKNGDGKISCDELREVLSALGPSATTREEARAAMSEIDKDGDGFIDLDEFAELILGGGEGPECGDKELKDAFNLYDLDGNGVISASELHAVMKKLGQKCSLSSFPFLPLAAAPHEKKARKRLASQVGRIMAENYPADHGSRRNVLEHVAQADEDLDSLENALRQLIGHRRNSIGPANIPSAPGIMLLCEAIKIIRQKLIFESGRQDVDPRFRLASAVTAVALGCVTCGLLMCVLLGDLPWPIFVACVLMLVVPFASIR